MRAAVIFFLIGVAAAGSAVCAPATPGDPVASPARAVDECAAPADDWIFCSGFEEGNLSVWDDYDGNPSTTNTLLPDPGPFGLEGNHVMRLRVPAGTGGADLVKVLPDSYDRLYARWYVKWEPGYDFNARNHGAGFHAGDRSLLARSGFRPDGTDRFTAQVEPGASDHRLAFYSYYRGMYQDCINPSGSCWGDHLPCMIDEGSHYCTKAQHRETVAPPIMEAGRWYCIEIFADGGTPTTNPAAADGLLNLWIDGVEYGPWTGLWMRTTPDLKLTILWLNLYFHAEHSTVGMLLDDVVVSTTRIGPGGPHTGIDESGGRATWGALKSAFR